MCALDVNRQIASPYKRLFCFSAFKSDVYKLALQALFFGGALFFCFKLQFSFSVEYVYFFFPRAHRFFFFSFPLQRCVLQTMYISVKHTQKKKRRKKTISSFFILFLLSAKPLFVVCCCCFDLFLVFVFCFPLFCYSCLVVDVSVSPPFPFFFGGNFSVVLFID